MCFFFFFKQKTAYEMRISDWSSDVCSSDLTADSAESADRRAAQRLLADLVDAALAGGNAIEVRDDTPARNHLLRSQTLIEPRRDHLRFYHDVLRDWAVGVRLQDRKSTRLNSSH